MNYREFIEEWNDKSSQIYVRTSGSTGNPKLISLPKCEMIKSAQRTIDFFKLDSCSHFYSCISPDYIGGKMMYVRAAISSGNFSWEEPSNRPLSEYKGKDIDLLAVVPSQMIHILDNIDKMPRIANIIIGGSPINTELRRHISASGLNAYETYGMTETASHIAIRRITDADTYFKPLPGVSVGLTDDSRLSIEIYGWKQVVTNDIAEIRQDGSFKILGRTDNVIITGAKKVHPEMIESILEPILDTDVLITSEPDEKWGHKIIMIINPESNIVKNKSISEIEEICKRTLPAESVPKEIRFKNIPLTANGKKQRIFKSTL